MTPGWSASTASIRLAMSLRTIGVGIVAEPVQQGGDRARITGRAGGDDLRGSEAVAGSPLVNQVNTSSSPGSRRPHEDRRRGCPAAVRVPVAEGARPSRVHIGPAGIFEPGLDGRQRVPAHGGDHGFSRGIAGLPSGGLPPGVLSGHGHQAADPVGPAHLAHVRRGAQDLSADNVPAVLLPGHDTELDAAAISELPQPPGETGTVSAD